VTKVGEVGPPFSPYFEFSGRIRTFNPKAFQYRWGRKVSPEDRRMFNKRYKIDEYD
jgi:hypothetical protein